MNLNLFLLVSYNNLNIIVFNFHKYSILFYLIFFFIFHFISKCVGKEVVGFLRKKLQRKL